MGTVSGAADVIGVHHATVIRHIDELEERLGTKMFKRHARGYTPTEDGVDLMQVAQTTDDQLTQLAGRIRGQGESVQGDLIVTSLASLSPLLTPVMIEFQVEHPDVAIHFLTGDRLFRLEYGEAHVAVRAGSPPDQPDNVVQPLIQQRVGLYASKKYIERYGMPESEADLQNHRFVAGEKGTKRAPYYRWMDETIPQQQISFRASDFKSIEDAVINGGGLGFMLEWRADADPDMVQILPPKPEWIAQLWLVTHVDLHRTLKVQTFLGFLKDRVKDWGKE